MFTDDDADALRSVGIDLDEVRRNVEDAFGPGALDRGVPDAHRSGTRHIPFTRDAKRALELSLREAIHLVTATSGASTSSSVWFGTSGAPPRGSWRPVAWTDPRVRDAVLAGIAAGGDRPGRTA